jgi:predicted negative regulator of RcsB-dependent stress response
MIALGDLLADSGDLPGARAAYEQAAEGRRT